MTMITRRTPISRGSATHREQVRIPGLARSGWHRRRRGAHAPRAVRIRSPGSGKWRLLVPDCRILERVMAYTELRRRLFHRSHEPTNSALFCSPQASLYDLQVI